MAERTMEELLRAPTEGYGEAIVLLEINADHFEIKTNLLQLVQANPFYGRESENPHAHINSFQKDYSTLRSNASRMNATSSKTDERIDKLADQLSTLVEIVSKKVVTLAPVKAVEETCVTCGGAHSWYKCPTTDNNQASVCETTGTYNQVNPPNRVSNQMAPPGFAPVQNNSQNRFNQNQVQGNNFNRGNNFHGNQDCFKTKPQLRVLFRVIILFQPKGEMKVITTRSGVAYEGPSIPTTPSPREVVEGETEETTDKEQTNFQGSTAQIPPPVIPISIPETDIPKTLPKTTPIPESDIPKSLPKPNIPYPSRRDDQKSRDKASNQMEKIFQIFQDLRFNISFADALLLIPRFAPMIKSLLMNKEKLLELAKIPLNGELSACSQKASQIKLGDPGLASINIMPLSIWKKLSLPDLTPTRMTLELADRSITRPKGVAEDIFVKVRNFHFPTDFVVVDFEADPQVPLILGRSFLRTSHALIDVYEGELILRDGNEQITFHVDGTSKHSQKHVNESIKMVNDTCNDSFKKFTDEPALVYLPPSEDDNDEKEKQEVKNLAEPTAKRQTHITPYSLIMGEEHLSTFSAEKIVPIPRESEDTSRSDMTLPLFDKELEDIECNDSYNSNLDESTFLVTPLSDSNKNECLAPGDDIEILLHHDPSTPMKSVAFILEGFIDDPLFEENDDLFDLECKTNDWKRILYDAPIDEAECFDPGGDNDEIDAFLAIEVPTYIEEGYYDSEGDEWLECMLIISIECRCYADSDSNREEIDIFSGPDDSIPPGIESDFDSEEDIIDNLLNDDPIPEYERLTFDMEPDVPVINNVDELNEDECFDPGGGEINVEVDNSFKFVTWTFLSYLTYPEVSPLLSSTKNEDTIFDPGIST
ncbi:reverse transcriptase domain-containing protein [Tanacetum coccineum]